MKLVCGFSCLIGVVVVLQTHAFTHLPTRHLLSAGVTGHGHRWNTHVQMTDESQKGNEEEKKGGDEENLGLWVNLDKLKQSISIPNLLVGR